MLRGSVMRSRVPAAALLLAGAGWLNTVADAQPMPVGRQTVGILVSDSTLDRIVLTRDLDGDGTATGTGEVTTFFDGANASGLPAPTGNVFSIYQAIDGAVFIGDGDTDTVYRLRDLDGSGDAQGAHEANVWLSGTNQWGLNLNTPNGIAGDASGAVYIVNAGAGANPSYVLRTIDLNGDGDAMDIVGDIPETTVWMNLTALVPSTSAFEISFIGAAAYVADLVGANPDAIIRALDADGGGIAAGEFGTFIADGNAFGVPVSFSSVSDGFNLYVHESTSTVNPQTVYRLTDLNGSGTIDDAGERRLVWSEAMVSAGYALANAFAIAVGPPGGEVGGGRLAIASNGSDLQDNVFVATDLDNNGDYLDAGRTLAWSVGNTAGVFADNVRQLLFMGRPCFADFNRDGAANSQDFFDFLNAFFAGGADFNGDSATNSQDFFDFLNAFFAGC